MIYQNLAQVFTALPNEMFPPDDYFPRVATSSEIAALETEIGETFPAEVVEIYTTYDMRNLMFADLTFGTYQGRTKLESMNDLASARYRWWRVGDRPKDIVCVASNERGLLLLTCSTGKLLYWLSEEDRRFEVSSDLGDFILCCANLFWSSPRDIEATRQLTRYLDAGKEFWAMYGVKLD